MISSPVRERVLRHIGVVQWYARKTLAGANPSPVFDIPADNEFEAQDHSSWTGSNTEEQAGGVSTASLLQDLKSYDEGGGVDPAPSALPKAIEPEITPPKVDAKGPVLEAAVERLCIRLYSSEHVLVLSDSAVDFPAHKELTLLANIFVACGQAGVKPELKGSMNWPVFNAKNLPIVDGSSLSEVASRWLNENESGQTRLCLVMGKSISFTEELPGLKGMDLITLDHSLLEMIKMPAKKAIVWRQLRSNITVIKENA